MKKKRQLQTSDLLWLSAVALLVLLQFWWLPGDPGKPDDTYSNSIEGKRGFFQTLKELADAQLLPPVRREARQLVPDEICTLVILSPDLYPNDYEQRELYEFVMNGGSLVFAPSWSEPDCAIPMLSIRMNHGIEDDEATVTVPALQPGSKSAPDATTDSESVNKSGMQTAEAEESMSEDFIVDTTSTIDESFSAVDEMSEDEETSAGGTNSVESTPGSSSGESTEDVVDHALRISPGTGPTLPQTVEVKNSDDFKDVIDLAASSPLMDGAVKWRTRAALHTEGLNPTVLVETASKNIQAAAWSYGNGLVLASASCDVFSNRAMFDESQAELAVRLVLFAHGNHNQPVGTTQIVVSEYLNTRDSYRGTSILLSPSLRSGTLQLLTIAVLAGWFGFHRFGPAKRDNRLQRRSLKESASAIGNLYFRTQSGAEAVQSYLEYVKSQMQRMFGNSISIDSSQAIAIRTGLDAEEVKTRIDNAVALADTRSANAIQAAVAIRDLSEILRRINGAHECDS